MKWLIFLLFLCACDSIQVKNKRAQDDVEAMKYYESQLDEPRACIQRAQAQGKKLSGVIRYSWVVNDRGEIVNTKLLSNTKEDPLVGMCILEHLQSLKFPQTTFDSRVTLEYEFRMGGQAQ